MKKAIIGIISIFILIILLIRCAPSLNSDYIKNGKLYISRILAINTSIRKDNNGEYSDYIEIYNGYSSKINLLGYHLSDNEYEYDKWTFPDIEIKPKETLVVYASGGDYCDLSKNICHTNFKLSGSGEVVLLTDSKSNIISKVKYPVQYKDTFYVYTNGKYTYVSKDGKKINIKKVSFDDYKLEITEYMTHNKNSYYDSYGNYYDFVEIHNIGNKDYSLAGLYISDDINNLKKCILPDVNIRKGEYLVIHFAGRNVAYEDGVYVNFGLSDRDSEIIISDGNKIIDKVEIVELADDVSYGILDNKWYYFTKPTPGSINDTHGFSSWGGNNGSS